MGKKNRSKKFLREEKSKVKLKKKLLPKGQNITDVSFKTKKIVIREQLKSKESGELLSHRKLNVKELFTRLQHHNTNMRQDGLNGLQEIVTNFKEEAVDLHLPQLIENITKLSLDSESSIRREAVKLLKLILAQVTEKEIAPQLDVLVSYVCCAMTHISQPVQEDSLLLLDVLLGTCPGLVVENSDKVLPRFLDMISRLRTDARPGRTLTVNLGSRMTGVAWRIQVLTRLHDLLHAMVVHGSNGQHGTEDLLQMKTVVAHPGVNYFPIFLAKERCICFLPRVFQPSNTPENNSLGAREVLKSYIAALMPLLFETWQEIVPDDDTRNLTTQCGATLNCILGILSYLWKFLVIQETKDAMRNTMTSWFVTHFATTIKKNIFSGFPFSVDPSLVVGDKKQRREEKRNIALLSRDEEFDLDATCGLQNLRVCYLVSCMFLKPDAALEKSILCYLVDNLDNQYEEELLKVLRKILLKCGNRWRDVGKLLDAMVSPKWQKTSIMLLLCDVILKPDVTFWQRSETFLRWLRTLPCLLCKESVPFRLVQALGNLASQNNQYFMSSLQERALDIIDNLSRINVNSAPSLVEGRKAVANLLYWLKDEDSAIARKVEVFCNANVWDEELSGYIATIVKLQASKGVPYAL